MKNMAKIFIIVMCFTILTGFVFSRYGPWWGLREQASTPETPSDGGKLFVDSNNNLFYLNESGSTVQLNTTASGDITDVWSGDTGDVSALTAASGDTLNAGSADSTIPWEIGDDAVTTEGMATWDPNNDILKIGDGSGTDYVAYGASDGDALAGDSATSFFDAGTIEHERGGLEADINAYTGLVAISGGSTSEVDSKSELEGQIADVADFAEADGDTFTGVHDFGGATSLEIPNANADVTANAGGELFYDESEDQFVFYDSQSGELIANEVAFSPILHLSIVTDPGTWYNSDTEIFIMTVGDEAPSGIIIDEWKCSCNIDPDTEIDADLRYADAWIGLANAADIDEIDTTNGTSSEDTDSNINGGSAVANGKVVYIGFDADPEGTCTQMIFEMWFHAID